MICGRWLWDEDFGGEVVVMASGECVLAVFYMIHARRDHP